MRFEYHHFAFLGAESTWAAEASECANEQGQFWPYHDTLFANQRGENQGAFSRDALKNFAAAIGLDEAAFNECLDSGRYRDAVQRETTAARQRDVRTTPTFIINGEKVEGAIPLARLQSRIEAELSKTQ